MLKQAALFVVSAGSLVYFVTPATSDQREPRPKKVEAVKAVPVKSKEDDGWGDEEENEDDETEFVFGEPMTESTSNDDEDYDEEDRSGGETGSKWGSASKGGSDQSKKTKPNLARPVHPDSPEPGELGSATNPKVLKTNNPTDPEDS